MYRILHTGDLWSSSRVWVSALGCHLGLGGSFQSIRAESRDPALGAKLQRSFPLFKPVARPARRASNAMANSPVYHVVFCVVGIMVLKEVNTIVSKPYMVCAIVSATLILA